MVEKALWDTLFPKLVTGFYILELLGKNTYYCPPE